LVYNEKSGIYFLGVAIFCLISGLILKIKKPKKIFYIREGFVTVSLSWIVISFFGSLPFYLSKEIPSFVNALFETVSGFTTTGSSILSDIEGLSHTALFWRSFTHWVGGMGVLVFVLAILPLAGGGYHMNLMKAESPGPSVSKLVPKIRNTAMILYGIYIVLTLLEFICLLIGGLSVFDALTHTFATAGTGGFSTKNTSFIEMSSQVQIIVTVFMILFGLNFNVYFLLLIKRSIRAFKCEEVKYYLSIILIVTIIITINISKSFESVFEALKHASFQVASIITTTGFSSYDYETWPQLSGTLLLILTLVGACAGSTGGGVKVSRIIILLKTLKKELYSYIHPRAVKKIQFENECVQDEVLRNINVFIMAYSGIIGLSLLLLSFDNIDFTTQFTAVLTTLNNVGPGFGEIGPTDNFYSFSAFSKLILMFDMLAGRLELFPMLFLFLPATWKKHA
jgi:trk system potassium uptake protein TrkH